MKNFFLNILILFFSFFVIIFSSFASSPITAAVLDPTFISTDELIEDISLSNFYYLCEGVENSTLCLEDGYIIPNSSDYIIQDLDDIENLSLINISKKYNEDFLDIQGDSLSCSLNLEISQDFLRVNGNLNFDNDLYEDLISFGREDILNTNYFMKYLLFYQVENSVGQKYNFYELGDSVDNISLRVDLDFAAEFNLDLTKNYKFNLFNSSNQEVLINSSNIENYFFNQCVVEGLDEFCGDWELNLIVVPIDMKCGFSSQEELKQEDINFDKKFVKNISNQQINLGELFVEISSDNFVLNENTMTYSLNFGGDYQSCIVENLSNIYVDNFNLVVENPDFDRLYQAECISTFGEANIVSFRFPNTFDISTFNLDFSNLIDSDGDGIPDIIDRCKHEYGYSIFNGCTSPLEVSCSGKLDDGDVWWGTTSDFKMSYSKIQNKFKISSTHSLENTGYVALSSTIDCGFWANKDDIGCVEDNTPLERPLLKEGLNRYLYIHNTLHNGIKVAGFCDVNYVGPKLQSSLAKDLKYNLNFAYYGDSIDVGKIFFDYKNEKLFFKKRFGFEELYLHDLNSLSENRIFIYKQGELDRIETVDVNTIALVSSSIKNFEKSSQITKFIEESYNLMTSMDIIKNYDFDGENTRVSLSFKNFKNSYYSNMTIYQVVPKSIAEDFSQIKILENAGAKFFVSDRDPVIGWQFDLANGQQEEIVYELPGNVEGGVTIITQEPIIYNGGDLIVNYRQGGCVGNEVHIFDIDSLENSVVKKDEGSGVYSICISHLEYELFSGDIGNLAFDILNFENFGDVSLNETLSDEVILSVNNNTELYWTKLVSSMDSYGSFSCLGSVLLDGDTSKFGDCGWTQNRIWLNLGNDLIAPKVEIKYPFLSNSMDIILEVSDNLGGSGVDSSAFCVYNKNDANDCSVNVSIPVTNPFGINSFTYRLNCLTDWSCSFVVKVVSFDKQGNQDVHIQEVNTLDKGSSCQADCTAKPSPNRYLKECRNLNSCEYYPTPLEQGDQRGVYVANQCDLKVEGSWVQFNSTHEIKCPNGPFRKSRFTNSTLDFSNFDCDFIKNDKFPIQVEGENVIMNVVSCRNFN